MQQVFEQELGNTFGYEWTGLAYQEESAGSTTTMIFILAILVAFLILAAQYESWTSPFAVIMGLPIALLGVVIGCLVMNLPISVYTQIGIILLIALTAKNAILIVEFARDYRAAGKPISEAAIEAGKVRLRPILMTSFAFILGVFPLVISTGARSSKSNLVRNSRLRRDADDLVGGYTFHAQFLLRHAVFTRTTNPKETEILRK